MKFKYSLDKAIQWRNADPAEIYDQQVALLRSHLQQAGRAPFYKDMFKAIGLLPNDITSLEDIKTLPLTTRSDIQKDPAAFQAVSPLSIADIALTSGTTGNSIPVPYSRRDLVRLAFNETMGYWGTGTRPGDCFLLCVTLDRCFIAGLAYYSGLVRLGASAIRSGPGQPARQWELIRQLKPNGLVGVPSFLLKLANWGMEHDISPAEAGIKTIVTIGEPVRKADHTLTALGMALEDIWGAQIFTSYGATELETAFCECQESCGGHIHPEMMITEIIDDNGNPLPPGHHGEVVVTPLGVEGFPLVRFRTGDISRIHSEPCDCGWQTSRLGAIEGRLAQRLKFRGTTLYPEMIFHALHELPQVQAAYIEARSSFELSDEISVVIGTDEPLDENTVGEFVQAHLRVLPEIIIKPKNEVLAYMEQGGGRKLKKFFDLRKENAL